MRGKNATSGMKHHPCSVSRSPSMRASSSLLKKNKTGGDFKEIDLLTRQLKKLHDGQPDATATGKKSRAKKLKNHFTQEQIAALREKSSAGWSGISGAGLTP